MPSIEHLQSLTLDLPPSCIEFWPLDPQYAVIGTYNLEKTEEVIEDSEFSKSEGTKKAQQRNGSLILLRVCADKV